MDLPAPLAWLVDEAGASPGPDRFLAELGGRLLADGLPLAGGALTLAVPHPIIAAGSVASESAVKSRRSAESSTARIVSPVPRRSTPARTRAALRRPR